MFERKDVYEGRGPLPLRVTYATSDGTFTVVMVTFGGTRKGVGVAKRNANDKRNTALGFRLAYARAVKDLGAQLEARALGRGR